jgi:hypothetical protein
MYATNAKPVEFINKWCEFFPLMMVEYRSIYNGNKIAEIEHLIHTLIFRGSVLL